ncbi:glutaconate CoA-transferase, subunit A [freshwater sediment metagenome]|jgi:glutaconate CoA-transferase subunit A|uniref:Glutaconate CoA-transferase, subunit A n=1 Tax=freshwater sediment metagenome TaxID=556182 RepID=A0AA48M1X7_9ZZZZ
MKSQPRPIYTDPDKRRSLDELAAMTPKGAVVAVGGGLSSREPMALLRALLRNGVSGLTVVGSAHGVDIDLLCAGGALARSAESYVGFEQDFGLAPNYRRALESGAVEANDSCCYTLVQQLRAAIQGLPFMPMRSVRGTSFTTLHPEYKTMTCPFTGEELLLVPALEPDVALIHAQYGDEKGNLLIQGPPVADLLFAKASRVVLATVEQIVSTEALGALRGALIPYFYVTAVSEVPMGAHPTACYPFYAYDRRHTALYHAAARAGADAFKTNYLDVFVHGALTHEAYLARIDADATRARLASWVDGDDAWMKLYLDETPA